MSTLFLSPTWNSATTGSYSNESPNQTLPTVSGQMDARNGQRGILMAAIQLPNGSNGQIAYSFNKIQVITKAGGANPALGKMRLTVYRYRHDNFNAVNTTTMPYTFGTGYTLSSNVDSDIWTYATPARIADGSLVKLGEANLLAIDTGENAITKVKDYQYHVETFDFGAKIDVLTRQSSEVWSASQYPSYAYLILEFRILPDTPTSTQGSYWDIVRDSSPGSTTATTFGRNAVGSSSMNQFSGITPIMNMLMDIPTNTNPSDITLTYVSGTGISETEPVGSTVGTLSAVDAEGGDMTFELVPGAGANDNNNFTIVGNQLRTSVLLDYETKNSHSIRVRVTDAGSLSFEKPLIISVINNVADDPVSLPATGLPMAAGKVITSAAVNPQQIPVTLNGQPLPTGSVIRNTATGQKFVKVDGGSMSYLAIDVEPKTAWGWSPSADALWEILQSL